MSTIDHSTSVDDSDEYRTRHHVYRPHKTGIPRLGPYARELLARREFAVELSRTSMRAANTATFFGRAWLVLNPLLLGFVYFLLIDILSPKPATGEQFDHLLAGLFAFTLISGSMSAGAGSVVGGGKMVMNVAFPRLLLPFSAVRTGFMRFLPTMGVYAVVHFATGRPTSFVTLLAVPVLGLIVLFSTGLAALMATFQVYFRDTASFLPYFLRIWLYLSPVLFTVEVIHRKFSAVGLAWVAYVNPLYSLFGMWSGILNQGKLPEPTMVIAGTIWSLLVVVGGCLFFMSREREFAVRL